MRSTACPRQGWELPLEGRCHAPCSCDLCKASFGGKGSSGPHSPGLLGVHLSLSQTQQTGVQEMSRSGSCGQSTSTACPRLGSLSRSCRGRTCAPCPRSSSASAPRCAGMSCMPTWTSGNRVRAGRWGGICQGTLRAEDSLVLICSHVLQGCLGLSVLLSAAWGRWGFLLLHEGCALCHPQPYSLAAAWMKEKVGPGEVRYCGEFSWVMGIASSQERGRGFNSDVSLFGAVVAVI